MQAASESPLAKRARSKVIITTLTQMRQIVWTMRSMRPMTRSSTVIMDRKMITATVVVVQGESR